MEGAAIEDFEKMCRTCMTIGKCSAASELQSLFDCINDFQNRKIYIFELIHKTIDQLPMIQKSDDLPKTICGSCLMKFTAYYEFQQCCLNSDVHLRNLLGSKKEGYSKNAATTTDPLDDCKKNMHFPNVGFIKQEEPDGNLPIFNETSFDQPAEMAVAAAVEPSCCNQFEAFTIQPDAVNSDNSVEKPTTEGNFACKTCGKQFSNISYLNRHTKRMHYLEQNVSKKDCYKCDECGSEFGKKVYLRKHKYRHKQPGGLKTSKKCDSCDMVFPTMQSLKKHNAIVHNDTLSSSSISNTSKPYVCEYCNKSFQQSCTLKDHKRTHTKEAPYLCSHCGKAFKSNSNLKQHLLRHTGEKRYECPDCPKKFPCLSDLCSHRQVHKKLRPHVCDICGAAFGKYSQLKKHNMYHSGEKPYQCEYCVMRFVCADHMRRHMRTHTGEKPYKCKYCTRTFTQSNDMIKHLRSHLGANVYQCELCPSAFRLAAELREHFAFHKNDDEETRRRNKQELLEAQAKLRHKLGLDFETVVAENNE